MILVEHNLPKCTALFLSLITKRINKKGEFTILCLGRSIFLDDVYAITRYSNRNKYIYFQKSWLGKIVRSFLKPDYPLEQHYHTENKIIPKREKIRDFLREMLPVLKKILLFDALMSCNIGYIAQQELFSVVKENNIPVIILFKEGLAIKQHINDHMKRYQDIVFQGDLLLCYNENIKKALSNAKITGLSDEKIEVAGIPRLDSYVYNKKKDYQQITFFSFYPKDKFLYFVTDQKVYGEIEHLSEQFHAMVMKYAFEHPKRKVVVKTKLVDRYLEYAIKIYSKYFDKTEISNLSITNVADSKKLIMKSSVIIGLNSTVLFEAILAGKNIITPDFRHVFNDGEAWDYFFDYPNLVNYAGSYDELVGIIENGSKRTAKYFEDKDAFLKEYIYSSDGQAGMRVDNAIAKLLRVEISK